MQKIVLPTWVLITAAILWRIGYRAALASDLASIWDGVGVICAVVWWKACKKSHDSEA
jgi:hypothetical protein